jgi:D-tyrosyl-tRNA(Tyr) deacylase
MRIVVQRVTEARVEVSGVVVGRVGRGLVVLLGVGRDDEAADVEYISSKIRDLRIFEDDEGKMNHSVVDVGGAVLLVSQFTLYGDVRKGRRPSFIDAAGPEKGRAMYEEVARALRESGLTVETGTFQAMMQVHLVNDGPVTIVLDSNRAS